MMWESPSPMEALSPTEISVGLRLSDCQSGPRNSLVWLEQRSGRGILVWANTSQHAQRDLTRGRKVRAEVGYGGADFALQGERVYFVSEGGLFQQDIGSTRARSLSETTSGAAAPTPGPDGRLLVFVQAGSTQDALMAAPIERSDEARTLIARHHFYMQPCWHPNSKRLAWIAWNQPNMPWDGTALMTAAVSDKNWSCSLESIEVVAGDPAGSTAYFQPSFSPDGRYLAVVDDSSGWFNLRVLDATTFRPVATLAEEAEHAPPAWLQGLRSYGWAPDSQSLYLIRSRDGFDQIVRFDHISGEAHPLTGEIAAYTSFEQISVSPCGKRLSVIASQSSIPPRILQISGLDSPAPTVTVVRRSSPEIFSRSCCSLPTVVQWPSEEGLCYGLFYPPVTDAKQPPLIAKIHGGPTSQYRAEFDPETQFFCSRGFAVLAVNYRGSSGFGRPYRNALRRQWGRLDVGDLRSAIAWLVKEDRVDPSRLVVCGGSAGGLTALLALARYPGLFKAGICRYAVSDLTALSQDTHKFESCYLESLVGSYAEYPIRYQARSPITVADEICDPLALFQGGRDQVVPPSQSEMLVASLRRRRIPHIYRVYEKEGHGWRHSATIQDYYSTVESFLKKFAG